MLYPCRCHMEQHVSMTANDSSSAGQVGKVPKDVRHQHHRLIWAAVLSPFASLHNMLSLSRNHYHCVHAGGVMNQWGEAYATVPLVSLSLVNVARLCVAPGDGFFVAASAYARLNAFLQQQRCRHLTAVLLGTEHRGTTPVALSRQVRAGNCISSHLVLLVGRSSVQHCRHKRVKWLPHWLVACASWQVLASMPAAAVM
jgi:hypothetical protein